MPGNVSETLESWEKAGFEAKDRARWRMSQLVFGGQSGMTGIPDVFRICTTLFE